MSENSDRPAGAPAQGWNPPKRRMEAADETFRAAKNVQSATECTGLAARVPGTDAAAEALSGLYAIHELKPQGNPGKDNPNNPPGERDFHRA